MTLLREEKATISLYLTLSMDTSNLLGYRGALLQLS